jgi:hypothetical protein
MAALNMILQLNGVPYMIKATPRHYTTELQYKVAINGNDEVMFAFDSDLGRYAAFGDDSINVPDDIELAIGARLNSDSLNNGGNL